VALVKALVKAVVFVFAHFEELGGKKIEEGFQLR